MKSDFDIWVEKIVVSLLQPVNADLLAAVYQHTGENDSFEWSFEKPSLMTFEDFSIFTEQTDAVLLSLADLVGVELKDNIDYLLPLSTRYGQYCARMESELSALTQSQTTRFEAIISAVDDGWSGAVFGQVMRRVQNLLRSKINN